jgi:hypothetical protein
MIPGGHVFLAHVERDMPCPYVPRPYMESGRDPGAIAIG